ncbi:MAG: hypothetical protein N3A62_00685 [Thermodesulfovibrionales bacterium]|nr:hypothetical protein [Thermodesulfovibrionales bacterium]
MTVTCPGIAHITNPYPEEITCPYCLSQNEIWSDETTMKCINCGQYIFREISLDCIKWCKYAIQCIGEKKYKELMGDSLSDDNALSHPS